MATNLAIANIKAANNTLFLNANNVEVSNNLVVKGDASINNILEVSNKFNLDGTNCRLLMNAAGVKSDNLAANQIYLNGEKGHLHVTNSIALHYTGAFEYDINGVLGGAYPSTADFDDSPADSAKIYMEGTYGRIYAGEFHQTSDKRLKMNIRPINGSINTIMGINFYEYEKINNPENMEYNTTERGVIAQDIQKTDIHYAVSGNKKLSVNYQVLYITLAQAFKDMVVEVNTLNSQVQNQQAEINNLKAENTLIKSKLNEILSEMGKQNI